MSIVIEKLSFTYMKKTPYEKKALDEVNLTIEDGEFFGIIGATGSGKSTLIQHLNALIRLSEGKITVDGIDLSAKKVDLKRLRSTVGMVFQYPEYQLFEETVARDVAFGPNNLGLSPQEVDERVREALEICGLNYEEIKERSPFELSGGQKRRVAIAGVIAMKPKILVFDEPTAGLDPQGRKDVYDLILRLKEYCSPTVILVSHNMDEIARYADRIAVLCDGRLERVAAPIDLFADSDWLESVGLDVPTTVRLTERLRDLGIDLPLTLTPEAFADAVLKQYKDGGGNA